MSNGTKYREPRQFCQQLFSFHAKTIKLLVVFDSNDYRLSLNATPRARAGAKVDHPAQLRRASGSAGVFHLDWIRERECRPGRFGVAECAG
jgi:hypothetical protein